MSAPRSYSPYPRSPNYGGYPLGQAEHFRRAKSEWLSAVQSGPLGPGFSKIAAGTVPLLRLALPNQRSRSVFRRRGGPMWPPAHAGPTASAPGSRCGPSNNLNLHQKNPLMRIALGHLGIRVPAHSIGILHQRVSNRGPCHAASNRAQFGAFSIVLKICPWAPLSLDTYDSLIYTNIS